MLTPCKRVGINLGWSCNWRCKTCFYRYNPNFNNPNLDKPIENVQKEIDSARNRGCNHVVIVGEGEPTLYKNLVQVLEYSHSKGMTTSIITNGSTGLEKYKRLFEIGINHLHISTHGLGEILNLISESPISAKKQEELLSWLKDNNLPWRSNTTIQKINYMQIPDIVSRNIQFGVKHFVFLGFLPHYEWRNRVTEVAVHPKELQKYIELGCDLLEKAKINLTIRYHPMCHLSPKYWKYVVNARYVLFDPWEWEYEKLNPDIEKIWNEALILGDSVSVKGSPCDTCKLLLHCGGWNNTYAQGFNGAELKSIDEIPDEYKEIINERGGLHSLNPVNNLKGYY